MSLLPRILPLVAALVAVGACTKPPASTETAGDKKADFIALPPVKVETA